MREGFVSHQKWADYNVEDIRTYIEDGEFDQARQFAILRRDGLKSTLRDIENALAEAEDIRPDVWSVERDAFAREVEELDTIIAEHGW